MTKKCYQELAEELGGLTPCVYNVYQMIQKYTLQEVEPGVAFRRLDKPGDEEMCEFLLKRLREAKDQIQT